MAFDQNALRSFAVPRRHAPALSTRVPVRADSTDGGRGAGAASARLRTPEGVLGASARARPVARRARGRHRRAPPRHRLYTTTAFRVLATRTALLRLDAESRSDGRGDPSAPRPPGAVGGTSRPDSSSLPSRFRLEVLHDPRHWDHLHPLIRSEHLSGRRPELYQRGFRRNGPFKVGV